MEREELLDRQRRENPVIKDGEFQYRFARVPEPLSTVRSPHYLSTFWSLISIFVFRLPASLFFFPFLFCCSGISLLSVYWLSITCLLRWHVCTLYPCSLFVPSLYTILQALPLLPCAIVALPLYWYILVSYLVAYIALCCRVLHILVPTYTMI